jgi:hypothetical protein
MIKAQEIFSGGRKKPAIQKYEAELPPVSEFKNFSGKKVQSILQMPLLKTTVRNSGEKGHLVNEFLLLYTVFVNRAHSDVAPYPPKGELKD